MAFTKPRASQINFDATNISDSLIRINSSETGANTNDIGIVFERGSHTNAAIVWDESADAFRMISTTHSGDGSTTDINISAHHNLHVGTLVYSSLNDGTTTLTATVAELNTLDGITATATELNYTDGVTSNIQTQLDAKAPTATPTFTGNATFDTNTLFVDASNNRIGVGTTSPAYQVEIENTGANALLVLDRTDGAACFIEGQATRSAFGSVGATPLALAYNSFAVVTIGANGAITVNPDGDGFTFPTTDGTSGQTLVTDGAGTLSFTTLNQTISLAGDTGTDTYTTGQTLTFTGGTGLDSVITDNTVTHNIDSTVATLTGTQTLTNKTLTSAQVTTDIRLNAQAELEFYDSDSSNYVSFRAPATITSNITWTLPSSDGTADQVLSTDGAGTLSWADAGAGGGGSGSSYPNSTFQTLPGTNGNFDLSYNVAQTSQETPFEAGGTDAFGVNLGSVFSLMDPIGSIETAAETGLDLGVLT